MHRRNILWGALSALGAAFAAGRANAATEAAPATRLKVVYHLNDLDKVSFVVGNIPCCSVNVFRPDTSSCWDSATDRVVRAGNPVLVDVATKTATRVTGGDALTITSVQANNSYARTRIAAAGPSQISGVNLAPPRTYGIRARMAF